MTGEREELPSSYKKQNILVVEDYEPNILVVTHFLSELEYYYDTARNGREAVDKFKNSPYTAILMDLQLPEMDGMEAIRQIRAHEGERNIARTPIVAMTGRATEEDRYLCQRSGADGLLAKPFSKDGLKNILEDAIGPVKRL